MNMSCPVTLKRYQGGQVGALFADVPEAITAGTNEAEALDRAQDAMMLALSSYLDDGRPLSIPSKAKRGQPRSVGNSAIAFSCGGGRGSDLDLVSDRSGRMDKPYKHSSSVKHAEADQPLKADAPCGRAD